MRYILILLILSFSLGCAQKDADSYPKNIELGDKEFHQRNFSGAEKYFLKEIKEKPENPIGHLAHCHTTFALGRFKDSATSLKKGLDLMPNWPQTPMNIKGFFVVEDDFTEKLKKLKKIYSENPTQDISLLYAYILFMSDQKESAAVILKRHTSDYPDDNYVLSFKSEK